MQWRRSLPNRIERLRRTLRARDRLIEMNIGKDLQYIRFNGMIVGGLAGLALHAGELILTVN